MSRAEELDDWSADEARAVLAWSRGRAVMRLGLADDLLCRLPEVFEALDAGLIDEPKAKVFSEWTENLPVDLAHHVCPSCRRTASCCGSRRSSGRSTRSGPHPVSGIAPRARERRRSSGS